MFNIEKVGGALGQKLSYPLIICNVHIYMYIATSKFFIIIQGNPHNGHPYIYNEDTYDNHSLTSLMICVLFASCAASSPSQLDLDVAGLLALIGPGFPSASAFLLCITFISSGLPRFLTPPLRIRDCV